MEAILIIIASTLIAACFLISFAFGFVYGQKVADEKNKKEVLTVTDKNKRAVSKYKKFAEYTG